MAIASQKRIKTRITKIFIMKDLVIIGAGNVGGFLALNQDLFETNYNIIGFLDDDPLKLHKNFWNIPVLSIL